MNYWYSIYGSLFSMASIGGSSFRLYLHGLSEYSLAVQRKKRTNTLKGTGEKKAPPRRVALKYRAGHLSADEVFVHEARFTSMGRPHCGLPPSAQPDRPTVNATSPILECSLTCIPPYGHRPTLNGRGAVPCSNDYGRRAVSGAWISFACRHEDAGAVSSKWTSSRPVAIPSLWGITTTGQ